MSDTEFSSQEATAEQERQRIAVLISECTAPLKEWQASVTLMVRTNILLAEILKKLSK